jgi:hypothetical protein
MSSQLKIDNVVHGAGGVFNNQLGRVTEVIASKPAVEDANGRRGCHWKENLSRVGTVDSRFGFCSLCKKPSEFGRPCPHAGTRGKQCPGIVQGDFTWRLKRPSLTRTEVQQSVENESLVIFLAKQFGSTIFRLGCPEVSDSIVKAVRQGLRDSAAASKGLESELPPVLPSDALSNLEAIKD